MSTASVYKDAGVDLDAAIDWTDLVKERIAAAWPSDDVAEEIGGFAGGGAIPVGAKKFKGGVDGTGTKAIVAALHDNFAGIGQDAVAMATVDTYISGGAVEAVWDILDVAKLDPQKHITIIDSIIEACLLAGCRLYGGETAELPDMFKHDWMFNLNICALAFPRADSSYQPVKPGQPVYGWPSNGVASNGFSAVRRVFRLNERPSRARQRLNKRLACLGETLGDALLEPTPIHIKSIEEQCAKGVKFSGHAHITGGGLVENIPRMLPDHCKVILDRSKWTRPLIFPLLQKNGKIEQAEMDRVFNQGIMVASIVSDAGTAPDTVKTTQIGRVVERQGNGPQVEFIGQFRNE